MNLIENCKLFPLISSYNHSTILIYFGASIAAKLALNRYAFINRCLEANTPAVKPPPTLITSDPIWWVWHSVNPPTRAFLAWDICMQINSNHVCCMHCKKCCVVLKHKMHSYCSSCHGNCYNSQHVLCERWWRGKRDTGKSIGPTPFPDPVVSSLN